MTYRVLLVDDEPLTLEYLSCAIPAASDSWTVAGAVQNGDDALAFLGETPVHLVITDIKMPGMNGLKLAQILKRRDPLQEIVILSGYDEFPLAQQALKIGVSVNYARYRLPDVLKTYMGKYPNVDIHVTTQQSTRLYKSLKENEISIALVRGNFKWDEGIVTLRQEPVCLVVSQQHARTLLNQLPYIGRHTDQDFFSQIERWRQERGCFGSHVNLWIDDIGSCLEMVSRGIGWAILPSICLDGFQGLVRPLHFPDGTAFTRSSHILYRQEYFELPQVKMFIQTVLADEYFRDNEKSLTE